jgi:hypothetical protein
VPILRAARPAAQAQPTCVMSQAGLG